MRSTLETSKVKWQFPGARLPSLLIYEVDGGGSCELFHDRSISSSKATLNCHSYGFNTRKDGMGCLCRCARVESSFYLHETTSFQIISTLTNSTKTNARVARRGARGGAEPTSSPVSCATYYPKTAQRLLLSDTRHHWSISYDCMCWNRDRRCLSLGTIWLHLL